MIRLSMTKISTLDNFETGCSSEFTDHGVIWTKDFKDTDQAIMWLASTYHINRDFRLFDDHLEFMTHENADGDTPTNSQMNDFKQGRIKLYLCDYSIYFEKVESVSLNSLELKQLFPELKEA